MAKKMPKKMVEKIERMNRLMQQLVDLNAELEGWLEENGVADDGFDFTTDYRDTRGYGLFWTDDFVEAVNAILADERMRCEE